MKQGPWRAGKSLRGLDLVGNVGPMISLYDTAKRKVVPLELRDPGKVSIYSCGPTVYAPPHIGHGRQMLVYDVLWRYLEWSGLEVKFVSNVTDIDDNIINRAQEEGREWTDIVTKCEAVWWTAVDRLNVRHPDEIPHAISPLRRSIRSTYSSYTSRRQSMADLPICINIRIDSIR